MQNYINHSNKIQKNGRQRVVNNFNDPLVRIPPRVHLVEALDNDRNRNKRNPVLSQLQH